MGTKNSRLDAFHYVIVDKNLFFRKKTFCFDENVSYEDSNTLYLLLSLVNVFSRLMWSKFNVSITNLSLLSKNRYVYCYFLVSDITMHCPTETYYYYFNTKMNLNAFRFSVTHCMWQFLYDIPIIFIEALIWWSRII